MQTGTTWKAQVDELTKQEFKDDIKELLGDLDNEEYKAKSDEIKSEYSQFFETVIEQIRVDTQTRVLTDDEIAQAKEYIFVETIKDERHNAFLEQKTSDKVDVSFLEWFGIQTASAVCPITTHPTYKQVKIDIDGGFVWPYTYQGDNDLYGYTSHSNQRTCETTISLYFKDEDHPTLDAIYDRIRQNMYDRIHDIEMFVIKNNNTIEFNRTWSNGYSFNCSYSTVGCHYSTTKSYTPGETLYVSNTWNHMMDISDTNPRLSKVTVP